MPASCGTSSGWPGTSVTSRRGRVPVASTATEPAMIRTRSATTPSKSTVVGESMVQRDIPRILPWRAAYADVRLPGAELHYTYDISRLAEVKIHTEPAALLVFVPHGSQPGRQTVHRGLELRVHIHELPEPTGQPVQADLILSVLIFKFLYTAISEVHLLNPAHQLRLRGAPAHAGAGLQCRVDQGRVLGLVLGRRARRRGRAGRQRYTAHRQAEILGQLQRHPWPGPHVGRLLLHPHDLLRTGIAGDLGLEL